MREYRHGNCSIRITKLTYVIYNHLVSEQKMAIAFKEKKNGDERKMRD